MENRSFYETVFIQANGEKKNHMASLGVRPQLRIVQWLLDIDLCLISYLVSIAINWGHFIHWAGFHLMFSRVFFFIICSYLLDILIIREKLHRILVYILSPICNKEKKIEFLCSVTVPGFRCMKSWVLDI